MKGKKKGILIASVCVLVLLASMACLYTAVTWNTLPQEKKPEPSSKLLGQVVSGALNGEEFEVTAEDVNAYLAYLGEHSQNELLQNITMAIRADDRVEIWMEISLYGVDIIASVSVLPEFSGESILLHIEQARAGVLSLPPGMVLEQLKSSLPSGIELQGDTLIVKTPQFSLEEQGIDFSVGLRELRVEDGKFIFRTDSVSQAIEQLLQLFLNGLFS